MDTGKITISLDQRTLALYGVGHDDYTRKLNEALQRKITDNRTIVIVGGAGTPDRLEYDAGVITVAAEGIDAGEIWNVAAEVWATLPKAVTIGGTTYCITQIPSDPQCFAVAVQARADFPLFSGRWTEVHQWIRRRLAEDVT
jgi:hypothetical protein